MKKAEDRVLTRSIARWVYDLRDDHRNTLVDGVEFRSRLGDEICMWAVFERSPTRPGATAVSSPRSGTHPSPLTLPELVDAFASVRISA